MNKRTGNILIVEDQPELLEVFSIILEKAGYTTYKAENGAQAIEILNTKNITLVLLDVVLPDTNGFDLLKIIKSDPTTNSVFVVLISSKYTSSENLSDGLESGADGYILKPINSRELVARIDSHIKHKITIDELRNSEERFRKITEKNVDAVLIVNNQGIITYANPSANRMFFENKQLLKGMQLGISIINGESAEINFKYNNKFDHYAEIRATGIIWENEPMQLVSIRDITERITNQIKLKESFEKLEITHKELIKKEKILQSYIESSPLPIFILLPDINISFLNNAAIIMMGYNQKEICRKSFINLIKETFKENTLKQLERIQEKKIPLSFESCIVSKVGADIFVLLDIVQLTNNEILVFCRDITESKLKTNLIEENEKRLRYLIQSMPVMVLAFNDEFDVLAWNQECENVTGYSYDYMLNNKNAIRQLFFSEDEYKDFKERQKSDYINWDIKLKCNNSRVRIVSFSNISNSSQISGWFSWLIGVDVTKRKEAEEALRELNQNYSILNQNLEETIENINKLNCELVAAKEKAEESNRLKTAFLANMSHEIRTPMNSIFGFLDLLKDPDLEETEKKQFISIVNKSGKRLLETINNIIDISKIDAEQMPILHENINIIKLLNEYIDFFSIECKNKGLKITFSNQLHNDKFFINTDKKKVNSIIENLIKNAIKYTDKGEIVVGITRENDKLIVFVKDSGIGIPENRREAIFERFVQADIEDRRAFQGSGLGLSIAKSYIEMIGGKIWLKPNIDVGTTFYFSLPIGKVNLTDIENPISQERKIHKHSRILKILVAEDDESSFMYINSVLKKMSCEVLHARNGKEAVEICKNSTDLDIVLIDIKMPIMDGYNALNKIREFNSEIIVIAQTAYAFIEEIDKIKSAGFNGYISKPIIQSELIELIEKKFNN